MRYQIPLLAIIILCIFGCRHTRTSKKTAPPLRVEVATVQLDTLCDNISFSTTIEPLYSVTIEPRVTGFLTSIDYKSGSPVRAGDKIYTIESTQYAAALYSAEAELQQALASLSLAESNYKRALPLAKINAISAMDLDQYHTSLKAAEADVKAARQSVVSNRLNLSYTTIKAPISGIIANTPASRGDYVGPGTNFSSLTTIKFLDTMTLSLSIPVSRYLEYKKGDSYNNGDLLSNIEITLADNSTYSEQATYYYTKQSAGEHTSTISVVVRTPNNKGTLKSGMFARVKANIGSPQPRITLPQRAVSQVQGVTSVWVVKSNNTVEQRAIKLGSTYGEMWSVESGISPGERVLTTGQLKMHNGASVDPITKK